VVAESEQGDIEQVVDAIGDELEEAMYGMIPRCAICGVDFLTYKGNVSMVGALKYHQECSEKGKPAMGFQSSLALAPVQAAKYLPETIILRLSAGDGKVITTLYFVWKGKDDELKSMRAERQDRVCVQFHLDEKAPANPNFQGSSKKKTKARLPAVEEGQDQQPQQFCMDLIGGSQIAPQPPKMLEPISIIKPEDSSLPLLHAKLAYSKFNLCHSLFLVVPCTSTVEELDLTGANLSVEIQGSSF
jgi:hypothetical protein